MTTPSLYPDWVYKELQNRLTEEEWKQLSTFLPAETWLPLLLKNGNGKKEIQTFPCASIWILIWKFDLFLV